MGEPLQAQSKGLLYMEKHTSRSEISAFMYFMWLILLCVATFQTRGQTPHLIGTGNYGTSADTNEAGTSIFKISSNGDYQLLFGDNSSDQNHGQPEWGLTQVNSRLWGVTNSGGTDDLGIIYSVALDGSDFKKIFDLTAEFGHPASQLTLFKGKLWGISQNPDIIFNLDLDGSEPQVAYQFSGAVGISPIALTAINDEMWGVTGTGGAYDRGTIFKYSQTTASTTVIHDFFDDSSTYATLTHAYGAIWGTRSGSGNAETPDAEKKTLGSVFRLALDGSGYTLIHSFRNVFSTLSRFAYGGYPRGELTAYNGKLWGVTERGGIDNLGLIFNIDVQTGAFTRVRDLTEEDGIVPKAAFTHYDGKLWSVASEGGADDLGTMFHIDPVSLEFTKVHDFEQATGGRPGSIKLLYTADTPPQLTVPIPDVTIDEDSKGIELSLSDYFTDLETGGPDLSYLVTSISNKNIYPSLEISINGKMRLDPYLDRNGKVELVIRATDEAGQGVSGTLSVNVLPLPDAPEVTAASTTYGTPTTEGLVVSRNISDDESVTHFQVSQIENGTLFLSDGITQVSAGDFVSFDEGGKGLVFEPDQSIDGSFFVQASNDNSVEGLGGEKVLVPISVSKAPLRIIAEDKQVELGTEFPDLTLRYEGFVKNENETGLAGVKVRTTANNTVTAGIYAIVPEAEVNPNYEISLLSGFLTVTDPDAPSANETVTKLIGTGASAGSEPGASVFALEPGAGIEKWLREANQSKNLGLIKHGMTTADLRLWGVTEAGGENGFGIVFNTKQDGTDFTRVHDFTDETGEPTAKLLKVDGYLWGSTKAGFGRNTGTLYRIKLDDGAFEIMHEFNSEDGWRPRPLIRLENKLYGMTSLGGTHGVGVIFSIGTDGTGFKRVFDFPSGKGKPVGELLSFEGRLWGTTLSSKEEDPAGSLSNDNFGTVFSILPDGSDYKTIHEFSKVNGLHPEFYEGRHPTGGLIAYNGGIWGMTPYGGRNNAGASQGTIFRIDATTLAFESLHSFEFAQGINPKGELLLHDGKLWGMAAAGGAHNLGTIFSFTPDTRVFEKVSDLSNTVGGGPVYDGLTPVEVLIPFTANIPDIEIQEGAGEQVHLLKDYFAPHLNRVIGEVEYVIEQNSDRALFAEMSVIDGVLRFTPHENANGEAQIGVKISGDQGVVSRGTFNVKIIPVVDGIKVQEALQVVYGSFAVNSFFVDRHISDGSEVTHFKISGIDQGRLYFIDRVTQVNNGDFISFEDAARGLFFNAEEVGSAQLRFQASLGTNESDLGGEESVLNLEVLKAPLVVEATDLRVNYGFTVLPTLSMSYSGFKNEDGVEDITIPEISTTAGVGNRAGDYPITLNGGESTNYELILNNGTLTINKRPLNIAVKDEYVEVNGAVPNFEIVYSGFVNGEDVSAIFRPRVVTEGISTTRQGVFDITTTGGYSNNYLFNHVGGRMQVGPASPEKGSLGDPDGRRGEYKLMGTTNDDDGTVFSVDKNKRVSRWRKFDDFSEGRDPFTGVIEVNNNIWGVTSNGGDTGAGIIYRMTTSYRNYVKVFDFNLSDGTQPVGKLVAAADRIWGMTSLGGEFNQGVIYSIADDGSDFRKEHDFSGADGAFPSNGLIAVADRLWGMTSYGGAKQRGVIFSLDLTGGDFQVLHSFQENKGVPFGDLLYSKGKLWGMTRESLGPQEFFVTSDLGDNGAIFSINLDGSGYTEVHDFTKEDDQDLGIRQGRHPFGSLVTYGESLWGLTTYGGEADFANYGTLFELDLSGTDPVFSKRYDFKEDTTGGYPKGSLVVYEDQLWGLTSEGGANGLGTIFSFDPVSKEMTSVIPLDNASGGNPLNTTLAPVFVDLVPALTQRIENQYLSEGTGVLNLDLGNYFTDLDSNRVDLNYTITSLSNSDLISESKIAGSILTLKPSQYASGSCTVYLKASSGGGFNAYGSFRLYVYPVPDQPSVTSTTVEYGYLSKSGLVIKRNSNDGTEVKYFHIDQIELGRLFKHDGVTEIKNGDFLTIEEGAAGLKFLPTAVGRGKFQVRGSTTKFTINTLGTPRTAQVYINKAPLEVRADNKEMRYGENVPVYTVSYEGFKFTDDETSIIAPPIARSIATSTSEKGAYLISLSGGEAENYELRYEDGFLKVRPAQLEVSVRDISMKYGAMVPELELNYFGFVNGDGPEDITVPSVSTMATSQSLVGSYPITVSGGKAENYELLLLDGNLEVEKAPLSVVADDNGIVYGEEKPAFTLSYNGFVNDEGLESITAPVPASEAANFPEAGDYAIEVLGGSADNYEIVPTAGTLTVSRAVLTATPESQTVTYGSELAPFVISYAGFVNGDDTDAITEPVAESDAGPASDAGQYPITLEGGEAENYTFVYEQGTVSVGKALLTVMADDREITYRDALPDLTISYTGFVNDDDPSVISNLLSQTTAVAGADVGVYPISLSGGEATNYELELINGTLTINKAILTVVADAQQSTYGDELPELTATFTGFLSGEDEDDIELPIIATTASAQSDAGTYPIIVSGGSSANYEFNYTNGILSIQRAPLTVIADDKQLIFGEALPELTRSYVGFVNGDGEEDITPPAITTDEAAITGFGSYPITLSGGSADNYRLSLVNGVLEVGKAVLTVTAENKEMRYGQAVPELTLVYEGFVDGEGVADIVEPFAQTSVTSNTPAGVYPINLAGGLSNNYLFVFNDGVLTVNKAPLVVKADDKQLVYGNEFPEFTVSYRGFVNGEDEAVVSGVSARTTATTSLEAGTYDIIPSGGQAANYELQYENGTLTIDKVLLRVIADDKVITYGDNLPALTFSYSGFINGDDPSDITAPTISSVATATSGAGNYEILLSGGASTKYALQLENGTLTIGKAELSVAINDQSMTYGQELPQFTAGYQGFINAADASQVSQEIQLSSVANSNSAAGQYDIEVTGGFPQNYELLVQKGQLTINKADLLIKADDQTIFYGDNPPNWTSSYTGFVNDDWINNITLPQVSVDVDESTPVGTYEIALVGGAAQNYNITLQNGTCVVEPAILTVRAIDREMTYGGITPRLDYTYSGFANDDDEEVLRIVPTISAEVASTSSVGTYPIELSGGAADNYRLRLIDGTLEVKPALLTVLAQNQQMIYGQPVPTLNLQYIGFVNGETPAVLIQPVTASTQATAVSSIGSYPISLVGGAAANYSIARVDATLTIGQAPLFAFANDQTMEYGDEVPPLTIRYEGFVNGDGPDDITQPNITTGATSQSNIGDYNITLSAGTALNYELILQGATLKIIKAQQLISFELDTAIAVPGQQIELKAQSDSGLPVVFTSSDESLLRIEGNIGTVVNAGAVTITASQAGDANRAAATPVEQSLTINSLLDGGFEKELNIIYPNPSSDFFSVKEPVEWIALYDNQGTLVKTFKGESVSYDVSEIKRGLYTAFFYKDGQVAMTRLMIWR
ncbi:MAG: hypothetical protein Roseis2KO_12740 [Roseivirga sp.]